MDNYKYTILVNTCEQNKCLLDNFFLLLKENFPTYNGLIKLTLKSDYKNPLYKIETIRHQKHDDFSSNIISCLKEINTDYILFFLEDFYLYNKINTILIENALEILEKDKNINSIYINDFVSNKKACSGPYNEYFDYKKRKGPYNCNCQLCLWRKSSLLKLLRRNENAWEFEHIGTYRANRYGGRYLYVNEKYRQGERLYPNGGILKRGNIKKGLEIKYSDYNITFKINKQRYSSIKPPQKISSIKKMLGKIYPFVSLVCPFVKRFGFGIPRKIRDESDGQLL